MPGYQRDDFDPDQHNTVSMVITLLTAQCALLLLHRLLKTLMMGRRIMRTLQILFALVAGCLPFTVLAASLTAEQQQRAQEVTDRINLYRKLHGLSPVTLD